EPAPAEPPFYTAAPPSRDAAAEEEAETVPADARQLYNAAYRDVTEGNYQLALMELREFLDRFGETPLADNAQYWIGEIYYAQQQYPQAVEEFLKVVNDYPEADKVPAAYLKTAFSFRAQDDLPTARRYLQFLIDRYPDTGEADLAREALRELP
ncbi:MAG: tol-pal system protein YbgF, partial [Candidatus Eisenbacteria bacterium]|nr:tol-pal system protein YbgF [Candidatus Eisenbacteria bacterium]